MKKIKQIIVGLILALVLSASVTAQEMIECTYQGRPDHSGHPFRQQRSGERELVQAHNLTRVPENRA